MAKQLVWTVRLEDRAVPHLWLTHEGKDSAAFIERHVAKCTALGHTVIVGLSSRVPAVSKRRSER